MSIFNDIKNYLFKEHTNCRCCNSTIKDGGVGVGFLGVGFCAKCKQDILK